MGKYLALLIAPITLNSDAGFGTIALTNWMNWRVLLAFGIHFGLLVFTITHLRKRHFLSFCILFYFITIVLNTNLFLIIGSSYGERFLFTPSLAYCLGVAFLLENGFSKKTSLPLKSFPHFLQQYQKPLVLGGLVAMLFFLKTTERNKAWQSTLTLMETDVEAHPNSVQLHYNYGVELLKSTPLIVNPVEKQQRIQLAQNALKKVIDHYPTHGEAQGQLGLAYYLSGKPTEAMTHYQLATQYRNNNPLVYNNMGMLFYMQQDLAKAQNAYQKAISLDPNLGEAYRNLAGIFLVQKAYDQAIDNYQQALRLDPNNAEIHYFMGRAYKESGDLRKAEPLLAKAYEMDPTLERL
ncbi:MAG: tetratricopeptide repeat protein [Bacteroidota bacterium]